MTVGRDIRSMFPTTRYLTVVLGPPIEREGELPERIPSKHVSWMPMSSFTIELRPPVPPAPYPQENISLSDLNLRELLDNFQQEYDIIYHIGGKTFCYYPASIVTVLNDIDWELQLIKKRESHLVSLSGYTVLELLFDDGKAVFYDPVERAHNSAAKPIDDAFDPINLEKAFKECLDSIWYLIYHSKR